MKYYFIRKNKQLTTSSWLEAPIPSETKHQHFFSTQQSTTNMKTLHLRQSVQEWTWQNLWKTDFQKFYLFHSWIMCLINPFLANVPILYPLKTPENLWLFGVFRGYKMGTLARNRLTCSRDYLYNSSEIYMN